MSLPSICSHFLRFRSFWEAFWLHLGSILSSFWHHFDIVFSTSFLDAFWERFGLHLGGILGSFSKLFRSKRPLVAKNTISQKPYVFLCFCSCFVSSARSKNRCESYKSGIMRRSRFLHRFWMPKVTKMSSFGLNFGSKMRATIEAKKRSQK